MEKNPFAPKQNRTPSHFRSLASFLARRPENVDFKLYDWLRTLEMVDLMPLYTSQ